MKRLSAWLACLACLIGPPASAGSDERATVPEAHLPLTEITFTSFTLGNGLTVIVHEDRSAPIVAMSVHYLVGSRDESLGQRGFAHLFEHLMVSGSENHPGSYIEAFQRMSGGDRSSINASTGHDRTRFHQVVPTPALDAALWLESDRMGHLLGAVDGPRLEQSRRIVQNELRLWDNNADYPFVPHLLTSALYPPAHPYHANVVSGTVDDVAGATLQAMHAWHRRYYGPNNAILVLAGDVSPSSARPMVERYFGDIPPASPIVRDRAWVHRNTGHRRIAAEGRGSRPRLMKAWATPEAASSDSQYLSLIAAILGSGPASRLHRRLVIEERLASQVVVEASAKDIAGSFTIRVEAEPGAPLDRINRAIDEELERLLRQGPEELEVVRAAAAHLHEFARTSERVANRARILGEAQAVYGDPGAYSRMLRNVATATRSDVQAAARRWLSDGSYTMELQPLAARQASPSTVDRTQVPSTGEIPPIPIPEAQRAVLANGLQVLLLRRPSAPTVHVELVIAAGAVNDPAGKEGAASLAMNVLAAGTAGRDAARVQNELTTLGATSSIIPGLDASSISLSTPRSNLDPSLQLLSDLVVSPAFRQPDIDRLRTAQIASVDSEAQAARIGQQMMPMLLYPQAHPYHRTRSGMGSSLSLARLDRSDLVRFHETWVRPNLSTLIVAGDVELAQLLPKLEEAFASWRPNRSRTAVIPAVPLSGESAVSIIDRPGGSQTHIMAGWLVPPPSATSDPAIDVVNTILGQLFSSRLNSNLREEKGWTYRVESQIHPSRGARMFIFSAAVQADRSRESVVEIRRELADLVTGRRITAEELAAAKRHLLLRLPMSWETSAGIGRAASDVVRQSLPDDYWRSYVSNLRALDLEDVNAAAAEHVLSRRLAWVLTGDASSIEPWARELELGTVRRLPAGVQ